MYISVTWTRTEKDAKTRRVERTVWGRAGDNLNELGAANDVEHCTNRQLTC